MIVLATFQDNYIAVPHYIHNGRGLEGKPSRKNSSQFGTIERQAIV